MREKKQSVIKGAFYYTVLQFVLSGMSFLGVMYFSRVLTKAEYGMVSNFLAWQQMLLPILTINLRDSISKAYYKYPDELNTYILSCIKLGHAIIFAAFITNEVGKEFFSNLLSLDTIYIRILLIMLFFNFVYDIERIRLAASRNYSRDALYMFLGQGGQIVLSVILVSFFRDKEMGRVLGIVLPISVLGLYILVNIRGRAGAFQCKYVKYALTISVPMLFAALSNTILSSSDRVMVTNMRGEEETAMYQIGYTVSTVVSMVWMALNSAYSPWLYDNLNQNKFEYIKKMTRKYTVFYYILVMAIMIFAPEILYIMGGEKYVDAVGVLPPVMLGLIFVFLYTFYGELEYFYGKTLLLSIGTSISAVINIILNLILIPRFGYIAAAYTTLIGYIFLFIFHYTVVRFKIKKTSIFDTRFFIFFTSLLVILQYIAIRFYNSLLFRGIMVFALGIGASLFIYKNRGYLKEILKK